MARKTGSAAAERLSRAGDLLSAALLARVERFAEAPPGETLADSKTGKALADEARSIAALVAGADKLMGEAADDDAPPAPQDSLEEDDDHDLDLDAIRADFDRRSSRMGLPRRCDLPAGDPREAGPGGVQSSLAHDQPYGPDTA